VGIALDDVKEASDSVKKHGGFYPVLVGASDVMEISMAFGNVDGVLPYSVLVDRRGLMLLDEYL